MTNKYKVGYTQGTFDMFHIGHLNLIKNAKSLCDKLIVGVNSDILVSQYKGKTPIISEQDRAAILSELRSVDEVIICDTLEKIQMWQTVHFDVIFIGDDWKGNERWKQTEQDLDAQGGVKVVYLKYTDGISSTILRKIGNNRIKD